MTVLTRLGDIRLLSTLSQGSERGIGLTTLTDGRMGVAWIVEDVPLPGNTLTDIFRFSLLNAEGTPLGGGGGVGFSATFDYQWPGFSLAALADGGFIGGWSLLGSGAAGGNGYDIRYGTLLTTQSSTATSIGSLLAPSNGQQASPDFATLSDGRVIAVWMDASTGTERIRGRFFDSQGVPSGTEFDVIGMDLTNTTEDHTSPTVAALVGTGTGPLANGGYVVAWTQASTVNGTTSLDIHAQVYDLNGVPAAPSEKIVTSSSVSDVAPKLLGLAGGRYVVVWERQTHSGFSVDADIVGRVFDAQGAAISAEFLIQDGGLLGWPSDLALLSDGRFVVTWVSSGVARAQVYNADGSAATEAMVVNTSATSVTSDAEVTALDNGQFFVAWTGDATSLGDTTGWGAMGQLFQAPIDVSLLTLADFALTAYDIQSWEPTPATLGAPYGGTNDEKPGAEWATARLLASGWNTFDLNFIGMFPALGVFVDKFENGFFTNDNAAAFVARQGNAVVLSFRGTNDNADDWFFQSSWDSEHWNELDNHYALFAPFLAALDSYIANSHSEAGGGVTQVYVTGHSMGAAMVNAYMDAHPNSTTTTYRAVTFANPGYLDGDTDTAERIANFWTDDDIIRYADWGSDAKPGDDNWLIDGVSSNADSHSMALYREIFRLAQADGVPIADILQVDLNNVIVHVTYDTARLEAPDENWNLEPQLIDQRVFTAGAGANSLAGTPDADVMMGGEGDDTLNGNDGDDILFGGADQDTLIGGLGKDQLNGGAGNDWITFDVNDDLDLVLGGEGLDTLRVEGLILPTYFALAEHGFESAIRELTDFSGQTWQTRYENYNANWELNVSRQTNDDGTRRDIQYDRLDQQTWSISEEDFDPAGIRVELRTYYDDNSRRTTGYDVLGRQTYSIYEEDYTVDGQRSALRTYYDDSSRRTTGYDTSSLTWSTYEEDFNTAGTRTALRTYNDEGSRRSTQWDPSQSATWALVEEYYTALGERYRQITDYDDGVSNRARLDTSWDVFNTSAWREQTTQYDALGNVVRIYGVMDDDTPFG